VVRPYWPGQIQISLVSIFTDRYEAALREMIDAKLTPARGKRRKSA
jgi:non-homologous end joining protein Ku